MQCRLHTALLKKKKKDVTKGHARNYARNYVATDPSHGGTQPARKGADRTNSILRKACHAHSVCLQIAKERLWYTARH